MKKARDAGVGEALAGKKKPATVSRAGSFGDRYLVSVVR
jgi:hypothetical protein